ncbi:basic leucine zipper transcriptional factor ATF-like 2 [Sorex fumeus]|uniref:basic leucine zipper transcriptional factor ATF-like 2 n=1 Tax=Sorex fumeus TaxID=62283 RepID=UPI0024AD4503|nr:basic leucine zipper transcriptional factor ATF-like 2 [Sorex fumeus]
MHLYGPQELLAGPCPSEQQKQLKKKQASRVAAQRSRQRHTDKADALHQQYESLEKHNLALRREIQALRDELGRWSRTLQEHECLCISDCTAHAPPLPLDCWGRAEQTPGPAPLGQHCSPEQQPGLFPAPPVSSAPRRQPHSAPSLLLSPPPSLSLGPADRTPPPAQPTSASGAGQLSPFSELSALLPCLAAPPQPLERKQPLGVRSGASPFRPSVTPELTALQDPQHPVSAAACWLDEDPGPQLLLAFPLLSSAQVHL